MALAWAQRVWAQLVGVWAMALADALVGPLVVVLAQRAWVLVDQWVDPSVAVLALAA